MSLPLDSISSTPAPSALLHPDGIERDNPTVDYELGGIALNDPSQGNQVQVWRCWTDGSSVWVAPEANLSAKTLILTDFGITEVSLALDQNMAPTVTYVADGLCKLYWFDSLISGFRTTTYPNHYTPMLTLDDKREGQTGTSDVLFFYVRDRKLCYRQQRDRYGVERVLQAVPSNEVRIMSLGMNSGGRLQAKMKFPFTAVHSDLKTDTLFLVSGTDLVPLHSGTPVRATWRSRVYIFDNEPSFSWAAVESDAPATLRVLADGALVRSVAVSNAAPVRLPATRGREWQVEVDSDVPVHAVRLASSVSELEG
jgi:hypothetical protein